MAGVEYMNDDPAEVDVLYGKVHVKDGPDMLQEVANEVVDHFCSKGLCCCFAFACATLGLSQFLCPSVCLSVCLSLSLACSLYRTAQEFPNILLIFDFGRIRQNIYQQNEMVITFGQQ
jgi:hypothetical protein